MFAILFSKEMDPFWQNVSSFPTVVFTFMLIIVLLYWTVAILGMVDIDILNFHTDGAGEMVGGDASGHGPDAPHAIGGILFKLGMRDIPVTIIISFVTMFGWLISYFAVHLLFPLVPGKLMEYVVGIPILLAALVIASLITAVITKPLRPIFKKANTHTPKVVLGKTAIVRTSRVDNNFGEATLADGGAGLILKVRTHGDTTFEKGDKVVLFEYNAEKNFYYVITEEEFLN